MTDSPTPDTAAVAAAPAAPVPGSSRGNIFGLIAVILAIVGFVFGVIPQTSGIAWLFVVPAIVLGIIGLTRAGKKKGTSIAAVIVGAIGWLVAIIVFVTSSALGIVHAGSGSPVVTKPDATGTTTAAPAEDAAAGIGDTVTSGGGIGFTVSAVTCGLATVGDGFLADTAKGQFCQVNFTLANGGKDSLNLSQIDVKGYIAGSEYESSSIANQFGGDSFGTDINPGLSADAVMYFDIPVGASLDTVKYLGFLSFDDPLVVKVA